MWGKCKQKHLTEMLSVILCQKSLWNRIVNENVRVFDPSLYCIKVHVGCFLLRDTVWINITGGRGGGVPSIGLNIPYLVIPVTKINDFPTWYPGLSYLNISDPRLTDPFSLGLEPQ